MQVTPASRQLLIEHLIAEVNRSYAFPDVAKKIDIALRQHHQRGDYHRISSAQLLSEMLTKHLQATSGDRHLRVTYSEQPIPVRKPAVRSEPAPDHAARYLAEMQSNNFGVEKVERLPFNIGYLELVGFAPAKEAAATLAAAMTVVAHTDALIIDLRRNLGGDSATGPLLASYLLDQRTRLNDFYYREGNRIEQRWSSDAVAGLRFGQKKDVYILTSKETFSAAEDFTYALKNLQRVTVVGETTGGGANPGDDRRLLPNFSLFVPLGRAISPVTQSNWEGVGVRPDVSVCASDALRTAHLAILKKIAVSEKDSAKRSRVEERIAQVTADNAANGKCG